MARLRRADPVRHLPAIEGCTPKACTGTHRGQDFTAVFVTVPEAVKFACTQVGESEGVAFKIVEPKDGWQTQLIGNLAPADRPVAVDHGYVVTAHRGRDGETGAARREIVQRWETTRRQR